MEYYITLKRFKELKIELEHLRKEGRIEISERLKRAKELGDLSENSEYLDAKDAQSKLEFRIFELDNILRNASIIKKKSGNGVVSVGSTVKIKREGSIFSYTIVGSTEAKPEDNLLSNESPLGKAFLNKKTGDMVEIQTPDGIIKCKIIKVE